MKDTDYSKTFIYKICCKDINITDIYVGHTTNIKKRESYHKISCNNLNDKEHYNNKIYIFIRNNGGWSNWKIVLLENFSCENIHQAIIRERYWYDILNPTLNTDKPNRKPIDYYYDNKKVILERMKEYNNNNNNKEKKQKYYKNYYDNKKEDLKNKIICICGSIICNYSYNRHLKSKKHINHLLPSS